MRAINVAREVVTTQGARLVRARKGAPGEYDVKPYAQGRKRGWMLLDLYTASAIVSVHDALNEKNRAHYATFPIQMMVDVAFKLTTRKAA